MIRGLSHGVLYLGISFLTRNNLKLICTEEEIALMLMKDRSASRAQLVDGGFHSFISLKSGKVLKATEAQRISTQVWRIPRGVTGDILIEISDKTVPGLLLPEIVYHVKKKLGCIFVKIITPNL